MGERERESITHNVLENKILFGRNLPRCKSIKKGCLFISTYLTVINVHMYLL